MPKLSEDTKLKRELETPNSEAPASTETKRPVTRISPKHRKRLTAYLKQFYKYFPEEKMTVFHFVKLFKERLKNDRDAWIGVTGATGTGKSLFAIMSMILFGRPMTMERNIAYIPKGNEIMDKFDKLNFNCLLIDEAAAEMRAVNWQSKSQQGVNVKAMTDRFKNNMVFLNMPSFKEFTKSMRQGNLQFRILIPYRTKHYARVIVQKKSSNWRSDDPWGDDITTKRFEQAEKKNGDADNDTVLKIERRSPSTVMDFIIPNLAIILPDIVEEYEYRKRLSREDTDEGDEKKKDVFKDKFETLFEKVSKLLWYNPIGLGQRKITKTELCEQLGVSTNMFNKFLKLPPGTTNEQIVNDKQKQFGTHVKNEKGKLVKKNPVEDYVVKQQPDELNILGKNRQKFY